jgi:hypothetical protein
VAAEHGFGRMALVTLGLAGLLGCGGSPDRDESTEPAPAVEPGEAEEAAESGLCLPLVSGCGCAYVCASAMRELGEGRYEVSHDYQDSRLDEAVVQGWCFDPEGRGSPQPGAPETHQNCLDVFFDQTPCGGECIPSTDFLACRRPPEGSCGPAM